MIAVINRSTVVSDEEGRAMTHSVHKQVREQFAPIWGISRHIDYVGKNAKPLAGSWQVVLLDHSDQAGALGYHDLTADQKPLGKVFAGTDKENGYAVSVTLSHEVLEMLGDPDINLMAPDDQGRIYAYENCDAVEADELGYQVDGVQVSDFVTPAWFSPSASGQKIKFDYEGHLDSPFELASGGYISYTDSWPANWQQEFAESAHTLSASTAAAARPRVGSRRERRRTNRSLWRLSSQ